MTTHQTPLWTLTLPEGLALRLEGAGYRYVEELRAADRETLRGLAGPDYDDLKAQLEVGEEVHDVGELLAPPPFEV